MTKDYCISNQKNRNLSEITLLETGYYLVYSYVAGIQTGWELPRSNLDRCHRCFSDYMGLADRDESLVKRHKIFSCNVSLTQE